ncbi:hydrogenobyrinic acid a,c-diamide synthase (glutamine-hydrolyzing) [Thermodesulfobacterium sp. TA1]|uniref:cobyrinate a,c-diamide synthase n=1 Tax=Thermodesulfobacterium sp. TA1 TaxID=2234087 RepID=UPI00123264BE|nr:cobyrinate a,c-diamide synthase [Thermodesulfobacterium sp. TA1]QER42276.1 hydrogenobyrinic acid a,c-diamide synthase (glutamine-hydrolyzing) [Thermodesulfobacterium sp. TA1]
MNKVFNIPRVLISSHKGGSGKTLLTIGLIYVFRELGLKVAGFKKGPDYIDAGWLSKISGSACRNLDPFLFKEEDVLRSFYLGAKECDLAVIEGNRGLFDGIDVYGSYSTAKLAQLLRSPVILVLDCTKVTRSLAPLVKGFLNFEQGIDIKGVVLNKIARPRHEDIIRRSIEYYTGVKVLGALPKLKNLPPERHLGLITSFEYQQELFLDELSKAIKQNFDLEGLLGIAKNVPPFEVNLSFQVDQRSELNGIKIGVFWDKAFQFYYPENLESFQTFGAEVKLINAFEDKTLPEIDGLYLGGGFPEVQAEALSENRDLMKDLKEAVLEGMPVYAECGGLMYLGKQIIWKNRKYPMSEVLPIIFKVEPTPQGHGYVIAKVKKENPYFDLGLSIKGHEFHYSKPVEFEPQQDLKLIFELEKGVGFEGKKDGILYKNLLAAYTHIHVFSVKCWAEKFLRKAKEFKLKKTS